jgi:hypothetical protein
MALCDRLIFRMLDLNCYLRGYSVTPARNAQDFHDHASLVQQTFFGQGHYREPTTPLKPEPPGSESWVWIARYRGQPIGTLRLIQHPSVWPMDLVMPVRLPEDVCRDRAGEIGRFNIVPQHRRRRWVVSFALLRAAYAFSRVNGIRWWAGCAPAHLILGFMAYSPSIRILEDLPLEAVHIQERAGREAYFAQNQRIRGFLFDLHDMNIVQMATTVVQQRIRKGKFFRYRKSSLPR